MNWARLVQRTAEWLIRASCRRLPEDERTERYREWSAELPAILDDTSVRLPVLRAVRALRYSAGVSRTARHLRRTRGSASRAPASGWRHGAMPIRPSTPASRLAVGAIIWLVFTFAVVSLLRAFPQPPGWAIIAGVALGAAFDAFCLADIVRAGQVRYLPKWAWVLICLIQTPSGGIVYLCVGRAGRPRPAPPTSAQRP